MGKITKIKINVHFESGTSISGEIAAETEFIGEIYKAVKNDEDPAGVIEFLANRGLAHLDSCSIEDKNRTG